MARKKEVMLRIDQDQLLLLDELAEKDEVSRSEYIRRLVKRSIAHRIGGSKS